MTLSASAPAAGVHSMCVHPLHTVIRCNKTLTFPYIKFRYHVRDLFFAFYFRDFKLLVVDKQSA